MNKTYKVFEYSWLQFEENLRGYQSWFAEHHYKALVDYHDNRGGNKYFELVRSGVRFSQYVGVIQVLDLTIEILPKTDKESQGDESTWHNVLLEMLQQTRFLQLDYLSEASLRYRKHSILHLYFMEFLQQIQTLIKRGLVKKYRRESGNLHVLKGALQFNQHIAENLIHKERFYTRHQIYDHQHTIHQILYEALLILGTLSKGSHLSDELNRMLFAFPEMPRKRITERTFETLKLDRKTSHYNKAIAIAKMIILNYSPDIKGGKNDLFALMFDMNELWEEYIYWQLVKVEAPQLLVDRQQSQDFWQTRKMRPDLIIRAEDKKMVLDTKWKVIDNAQPSDEDLRQVFAYNIYWNVDKGFLIYPKTLSSPKTEPGIYHKGHQGGQSNMTCQVVYVNVLDQNNHLNSQVGKELLAILS